MSSDVGKVINSTVQGDYIFERARQRPHLHFEFQPIVHLQPNKCTVGRRRVHRGSQGVGVVREWGSQPHSRTTSRA